MSINQGADGLTVVVGDSHGNWPYIRDAIKQAAALQCDAVVSVGDFGIWPGSGGQHFIESVDRAAADADLDVLVVPGNHDDYDQINAAPTDDDGWHTLSQRVKAAPRPHLWTLHGRTWLGFGGAASIEGPGGVWEQARGPVHTSAGALKYDLGSWWPEERITDAQVQEAIERIATSAQPVEVLISHDAPTTLPLDGTPFPLGLEQQQRLDTVVAAADSTVHVCGHWHRHVIDTNTRTVVLSADVNVAECQWALVVSPADPEQPVSLWTPQAWGRAVALPQPTPTPPRVSLQRRL